MPAHHRRPAGKSSRRGRLSAGWAIALIVSLLVVVPFAPATARDWTPQIKVARSSQVHWEAAMRSADRQIRAVRRAERRARASLRRVQQRVHTIEARHRVARRRLAGSRRELRDARAAGRAERVTTAVRETPAVEVSTALPLSSALVALPELIIAMEALAPDPDGLVQPTTAVPPGTNRRQPAAAVPRDRVLVGERRVTLLERRVERQRKHVRVVRRKVQRAQRAVQRVRARLSGLRARERAAVARREQAERSLGSWILAMERYAHVRATKMARHRPGVDTPLAWPARGRVSQYYGRSHDGLDIAGYRGSPIRAAAFGVVAYVGWNPWDEHGRAFMVVLAHAGRLETLYGHILPRRAVRVGQPVKRGQVIGYMGSTGKSTGPHLHLEVRRGRTTLNPLGFL